MSNNEAYFLQDFTGSFGTYDTRDEDIHTELKVQKQHYGLTETQYFSFAVPEENVYAFLYIWCHPNLSLVSGGPVIMQGIKSVSLSSELFDYRSYVPDSQIGGVTLSNFRLDSGYSVEMTEPGRQFRVCYDDPSRQNRFDVLLTAVTDPLVWPGSRHFEQVMHAQGELVLRGREYAVDAFGVRDRSWGEARLEDPNSVPPIGWVTGVFDEGFSFNVTGFDNPDLNPIWKERFTIDPEKAFKFGWMVVDGEQVPIRTARTLTKYHPSSLLPVSIEVSIVDGRERTYQMRGTIIAGAPINAWLNIRTAACLIRWDHNGKIGHGEIIQAQGGDFLQAYCPG